MKWEVNVENTPYVYLKWFRVILWCARNGGIFTTAHLHTVPIEIKRRAELTVGFETNVFDVQIGNYRMTAETEWIICLVQLCCCDRPMVNKFLRSSSKRATLRVENPLRHGQYWNFLDFFIVLWSRSKPQRRDNDIMTRQSRRYLLPVAFFYQCHRVIVQVNSFCPVILSCVNYQGINCLIIQA